jgi:hypothetical protein
MSKRVYCEVLDRMRQVSVAPVGVSGESGRWQKLVLKGKKGTLTLNSMEPERPGDEFSSMILGLHSLFWNAKTDATERRKRVLDAIASCVLAIGVVADPVFDESEGYFDLVLDVAKIGDGVIFNGSGILDSEGRLLLDPEGRFDA